MGKKEGQERGLLGGITKVHAETLEGDEYVHYLE